MTLRRLMLDNAGRGPIPRSPVPPLPTTHYRLSITQIAFPSLSPYHSSPAVAAAVNMQRIFQYYGRYQSLRGGFSSFPGWAKLLVLLAAIPGIILLVLSILAAVVSIAVLSLLTVPVYKLVSWVAGTARRDDENIIAATVGPVEDVEIEPQNEVVPSDVVSGQPRPRRQIDVRIIE